jgi:hypothetical protein
MAEKVTYTIEIDDNGVAKAVNNVTKEVVSLETALKKTNQTGTEATKSLTVSVRDLTLAYTGIKTVISDVIGFVTEFTDAYAAQEQATKNLTEVETEHAEQLEELTGINDTIIEQAMTQGKLYGLYGEKLNQATEYAIGLAGTEGNLADAMKKAAAAVNGQYGELAEYIPQLKGVTDQTQQAQIVQEYMANSMNKVKESMTGVNGATVRMKNEVADVKEEFGKALSGALVPMLETLTPLVKWIGDELPTALGIVSVAIVARAIPAVVSLTTALYAQGAAAAFATGGLSAIGGILGTLAVAGGTAWMAFNTGAKETNTTLEDARKKFTTTQEAIDYLNDSMKSGSVEYNKIQDEFEDIVKKANAVEKQLNSMGLANKAQGSALEFLLNNYVDLLEKNNKKLKALNTEMAVAEAESLDEIDRINQEALAQKKIIAAEEAKLAKERNATGTQLLQSYNDQLWMIDKDSQTKRIIEEDIRNRESLENLKTSLDDKKITRQVYNQAVELENQLHQAKVKEIGDKMISEEFDASRTAGQKLLELKKTQTESYKASLQSLDESYKNFQSQQIDAADSTAKEIEKIQRGLYQKTLVGSEAVYNQLKVQYDDEVLAHKDMWTRKLLTDDEFIDWYLTRTKQLHVEITDEWKAMSEDIAENSILSEAMNQIDQMFQELSDSATETRNNRLADIEFEREYEANAFQERMAQYDAELNQANLNEAQRRKILLDREKTERDYRKKEHAWRKEEEELTKSATDRLATIAKESIKAGILAVAKEASAYAFLQVMKTVPFPFNLPLAIAAGAGAYGLVSAMAQFRTGGYTGEGNEWDEAGIVHKKEYVIDAPTTSAVGKENLDALRRGQAMVVPVESVRPVSVGGNMITSAIDSLSNELAINSSIANAESSREVVVINNSDFVEVTRMVDKTMKDYSSIGTNKSIRSFAK